jgi:hypothetical protein
MCLKMNKLIFLILFGFLFVSGEIIGQDNRKLPSDSELDKMKKEYSKKKQKGYPHTWRNDFDFWTRVTTVDVSFSAPIKFHEKIELGKPKEFYEEIGYSRAKWSGLRYVVKITKKMTTTYDDKRANTDISTDEKYEWVSLTWASEEGRWFLAFYDESYPDPNTSLDKEYRNLKNLIFEDTEYAPGFAPEIDFKTTQSGATVSISPSLSPNDKKTGLIPAIDEARALVSYDGTPSKKVLIRTTCNITGSRISLAKHPMKDLDHKKARNALNDDLVFETDKDGKLDLVVFFRLNESEIRNEALLKSPKEIKIALREEGKKKNEVVGTIKVGLGLQIYDDKMIFLSAEEDVPNHAYYAFVKSSFHKNFDLLAYQERTNKCPVAKEMVVNLRSVPINFKPDGSHMVDGVSGKADVVPAGSEMRRSVGQCHIFSKAPKGVVLTVASYSPDKQPYHENQGMKLPAIVQKQNGVYTKGIYGVLQLAEREERSQERIPARIVSLEPRVMDGKIFVISMDRAQSFSESFACMLEAQSANQLAVLTLLETIPPLVLPGAGVAIGEFVSLTRSMAGALCHLASGDYKKFVEASESFGGKKVLELAVKKGLIPKMVSGKSSEKFLRLIGEDVSLESRKGLAKALEIAYGTGGSIVDEVNTGLSMNERKKEIDRIKREKAKAFNDYQTLTIKGGDGSVKEAANKVKDAQTKLKKLQKDYP